MAGKKKPTEWQKRFSAAFSGKKLEIKKSGKQDDSFKAREERRKSREAKKRAGTW